MTTSGPKPVAPTAGVGEAPNPKPVEGVLVDPNALEGDAAEPNADVLPKAEDEPNAPPVAVADAGGVAAEPNPKVEVLVPEGLTVVVVFGGTVEAPNAEPDAAGFPNPPNPPDAGAGGWPNAPPAAGAVVLDPNADVVVAVAGFAG